MSRDINAEFESIVESISPEAVNPEWYSLKSDLMADLGSVANDSAAQQLERKYNKLLYEQFPLQDEVTFSGKIRIERYSDNIQFPESLQEIMWRYPVQSDEYGEFYEVAGEPLLLEGMFIGSEDEDGGVSSLTAGFTFCTLDDDIAAAYTIIAHPEDIIDVAFSRQDPDDTIERLSYSHPDIHQQIDELLPMAGDVCKGFEQICTAQLSFPPALQPEVISSIETMMSNRLYNEGARYTVHMGGTLHSINDNGEVASMETDQPLKHAVFSHVVLQHGGSSLKPYAVFEVPIGNESLSVVCMTDIEDIVHIEETTKDLNAHLGELALLLGDPSYMSTETLSRTISSQLEGAALFPQHIDPYDNEDGAYLFPVPLLQRIRQEFDDNPAVNIASFAKSHQEEMSELLKPIRMRRGRFADEQGRLFGLDKGESLEGVVSGITTADFEDGLKKLAVQLDNATITSANGEVHDYFRQAPVLIILDSDTDVAEVWHSEKDV